MKKFRNIRLIAAVLAVLFAGFLGLYVVRGIGAMDEQSRIYMTGYRVSEDVESGETVTEENPVTPDDLADAVVRTYLVSLMFLILCYGVFTVLNIRFHMEMQGFGTALFLLLIIGLSYKVLFSGFTGLFGEASFTCFSVVIAAVTAVLWRRMHHRMSDRLYLILVAGIAGMLLLHLGAEKTQGAQGWLNIGGISVQLGEPIKALLVVLGACSYRNRKRSMIYCGTCLVSSAGMVLINDIGAAAVLLVTFVLMTYLLFDNRLLSVGIILCGCLLITYVILVSPHALNRFVNWGNAMTNESSAQQRNFITACIAAGWKGLGFEEAYLFTTLTASRNDAAIAGIMCVYGLGMVVVTMGCYCVLIFNAAYHVGTVPSTHLILFQIASILFTQVMFNYAGSLDALPFTGINAPALSTGGSSTLTMGVLFGLMAGSLYPSVQNRKLLFKGDDVYAL